VIRIRRPIDRDDRSRGQVLVMFVAGIPLFLGIMAIVIDIGSFWNASIHVQLAAEAAALAGVPYMPGDFNGAKNVAQAEAAKNGFGSPATVTPAINAESNRRLDVTVSATFGTYFLRIFGMNSIRITRTATAEYTLPVPMGSPLNFYGDNTAAHGLWSAAAMTMGSNRTYGDAYGTYYNPSPTLNNQYDPNGYAYGIEVPAGAGATNIDLYDPAFCAVDANKGTGDHWIAGANTGVSVYYVLWSDPAATPLDYSDDVQVASTGTLFENIAAADKSGPNRAASAWPASMADCTNDPYHDEWWTFATVTTPGSYRLQVTTTNPLNPGDQLSVSAENMWGLRAVPTNAAYRPSVYGLGKMVIYANVAAGVTEFYLGQIEAVHAGKTMVIQLFDPGDASGTSQIEILKPTTANYTASTFSYTADSTASGSKLGTNVNVLKTTISGSAQYNNSWVTLTVPLPATYNAPHPATESSAIGGGWWKIRYTFTAATSDTTTWMVSIRGNPVHLVQP
jgi:Flp pilus assembly protein TadG